MSGYNRVATFIAAFARGLGSHGNAMNCFCLDEGACDQAIDAAWVSQQSPDFRAFLLISLERFESEFRTIANSRLESF
jgi:hypothetical protein